MLDGVIWIWTYTFGSYNLHDLSKYATLGLDLKVTDMYVFVNNDAWDALPEEWQKLANFSAGMAAERYDKYLMEGDLKWIPIFNQAGIEVTQLPPEERAKLVAKAEASYEAWIKDMEDQGLPGREVFEYAKAKRDEIVAKYEKE